VRARPILSHAIVGVAALTSVAEVHAQATPGGDRGEEAGVHEAVEAQEITVRGRLAVASINGVAIDPINLPQNVRLIDSDAIAAIGATRLDTLLDLAGSVARQNDFGGLWDNYAIRGFSGDINGGPDLLINRFASNRGYNATRDVATIELFQVLEGSASALSGKGEPGGSINIVTKAPLAHAHFGGQIEAGSFDHYRGAFDIGGPVTGRLSVRVIGVREDNGSFRDLVGNERVLFAPSVAFNPSDRLHFLYQLEYSLAKSTFDRGIVALPSATDPLVLDGRALPRDRFFGEPGDGDVTLRSAQHQGSVQAALSDTISLDGGVQYRNGTLYGFATEANSRLGNSLRRRRQLRDYGFDDLSGRIELSAKGNLSGLDHQFRVGADAYRYDLDQRIDRATTVAGGAPYQISITMPRYGQLLPATGPTSNNSERQRGEAAYAQDLISWNDRVTLLLGLRHDWIAQRVTNNRTGAVARQTQSVTSPRAALTVRPVEPLSVYASWGRSFRFNNGLDAAGNSFAPERGEAYEAGVKFALANGRINGTLSAFRITKRNILVSDPVLSGFPIAVGRARSQGLEADLNIRVARLLDLTAVYALVDSEVLADDVSRATSQPIPIGTELSNVPRHSGAVFAQYRTSREPSGFARIGAGLTYVGNREGTPNGSATGGSRFRLPGYVTARASLGYQLSPAIEAYVNAENLFDKYYLASSYNEFWIMPGAPRAIRGGVRVAL
jgi:iron complex outermembrane receptor protein